MNQPSAQPKKAEKEQQNTQNSKKEWINIKAESNKIERKNLVL